jgi:hypothetical protein
VVVTLNLIFCHIVNAHKYSGSEPLLRVTMFIVTSVFCMHRRQEIELQCYCADLTLGLEHMIANGLHGPDSTNPTLKYACVGTLLVNTLAFHIMERLLA